MSSYDFPIQNALWRTQLLAKDTLNGMVLGRYQKLNYRTSSWNTWNTWKLHAVILGHNWFIGFYMEKISIVCCIPHVLIFGFYGLWLVRNGWFKLEDGFHSFFDMLGTSFVMFVDKQSLWFYAIWKTTWKQLWNNSPVTLNGAWTLPGKE